MKASWPVHNATRSETIWKQLIHSEMPWFLELKDIIKEEPPITAEDLDYKRIYLWADKVTTPEFGMRGRFMGVANRRRIWGPCQQLADLYFEKEEGGKETSSS